MKLDVMDETQQRIAHERAEAIDIPALEADLRAAQHGEVRFDDGSRALYATDGSNYRQTPIGVVIPRSIEDVIAAVRVCYEHGAPITSRGGGTSLCGQTCNVAVIIDFSKYLNRILGIDPKQRTARVQPGAILDDLRNQAEAQYGLTFPPDPSTHEYCTLGGMIGNNSCGVHSIMGCTTHYIGETAIVGGRTSDCLESLEILTYDGHRMTVGMTTPEELSRIIAEGGRRGEIYQGLADLRDQYSDRIRERYPKIPRRVSGYNLDDLLPENGFHVGRALVGTEGTCVIVLEATVKLVPSPPARSLLVLGYKDVYEAADHIEEVMAHDPVGLEGMDEKLIDFMQKKHMHPQDVKLMPDGHGWLLAEFGGQDKGEADDKAKKCMDAIKDKPDAPSMKLFDNPAEEQQVWAVRKSGLGATAFVPGLPDTWPGWEDAAVDPSRLSPYLHEFRDLLNKHGLIASLYGHFGQGCIHCRISFGMTTHEGVANYMSFIEEAADLVVKYGGCCSAEHGDGQSKAIFLPRTFGEELMEAMRRFKMLWDPAWKMNPGKVIEPNQPDENLRLGADYEPWQPETHFKFPDDDGAFSRATLRCVGVGKCRRTHDAFMCPSFLATREEKDTTRGRAHLLFEMLRGETITDGWRSEAVHEALDLCLGCKGCKTDCPVNVDMATYKSEFLSHYYQGRLRPRAMYAMGLVGTWANLGSRVPRLANFLTQTPGLSGLAKWAAGVSPQRRIPPMAREPFTRWFHERFGTKIPAAGRRDVLLYPDAFNNYFYPQTLKAAVDVLRRLGYGIIVPAEEPPCIRPVLHYGMLTLGKRLLRRAIAQLRLYARAGVPIIGLEPSTVAVFREELRSLFPSDHDGNRIRDHFHLLSEFLLQEDVTLPKVGRRAVLHGHCHQKAVLDMGAMRKLLEKMDITFDEPDQGCCGMAGSFGFEKEHYDLSMQVAELTLLPAVRQADKETLIIADGFSCRTQVLEATDRHPMHFAEVVKMAFDHAPVTPYPEQRYATVDAPTLPLAAVALTGAAVVGATIIGMRYLRRR